MFDFIVRIKKSDGSLGRSFRDYVRPADVTKFLQSHAGVFPFVVQVMLDDDEIATISGEHWRRSKRPNPDYEEEMRKYRALSGGAVALFQAREPVELTDFDWETHFRKIIHEEKRHRVNKRAWEERKAHENIAQRNENSDRRSGPESVAGADESADGVTAVF